MRIRATWAVLPLIVAASIASAQGYVFEQPWLGIALAPGKAGVLVKQVVPDTPAEKAGVLEGDEITAVGERPTPTPDELIRTVSGLRVGDEVTVAVQRDGRALELEATLTARLGGDEVVRRVLIDKAAPGFDLTVVSGAGGGALTEHRGKVLVVEFFSVTCKYCPLTHAALAKALGEHGERGLAVVGVSADPLQQLTTYLDPDHQPAQRTLHTRYGPRVVAEPHYGPLGFSALHDAAGEVRSSYWVSVFPTVVVIDREGYVRHLATGAGGATDRAIAVAVELLDEPK